MRNTTNKKIVKVDRRRVRIAAIVSLLLLVGTAGVLMLLGSGTGSGSGDGLRAAASDIKPVEPGPLAGMPELRERLKSEGADINCIASVDIVMRNASGTDLVYGAVVYFTVRTEYTDGSRADYSSPVSFTDTQGLSTLHNDILVLDELGSFTVTVSAMDMSRSFDITVSKQQNLYNPILLINKTARVPSDYVAGELVLRGDIDYVYGTGDEVSLMAAEAAEHFAAMAEAAERDGVYIYFLSGHRDYSLQQILYDRAGGENQTDTAPPGASEHQSGLCVDVTWDDNRYGLYAEMEYTAGYAWLHTHCYEYGFILRYPKGYEDVTGYDFEPWHYRYIGVDAAIEFRDSGCVTLEEYSADKII
ncbi:MAG: M15 family metallopeptidase [Eubacteriaceae bacterium]|nr:M15 family metallopeptidase [Eubacteriaceae bacterium]